MASSNSVTLTFAADTRSFDRGVKDVQAGSEKTVAALRDAEIGVKQLGDTMEKSNVHSMSAAKGFREAATGLLIMSNELPPAVSQTALLAVSVGDLAGAYVRLAPALKNAAGALTLGKLALGGVVAAIATAGVAISAHIDHTSALNEVERTAADSGYYLAEGLSTLTAKIPFVGNATDALRDKMDALSKATHGVGDSAFYSADALKRLAAAHEASLFQQPDQNPGGDAFVTPADLQDIASQVYDDKSGKTWSDYLAGLPKEKVSKGLTEAQKEANTRLAKWQSTIDKARQIGKSIADALAPKLEAADQNLLLFKGPTLLDKLNKQLQDTKHLAQDISRLTKMGLSGDLIGQLVAGGLGSIPAADELLAGGKSSVSEANRLSKAINKTANGLATNEAVRQYKLNGDLTLKVDPKADGDVTKFLVKLLSKYTRTNAGGNVQLSFGK